MPEFMNKEFGGQERVVATGRGKERVQCHIDLMRDEYVVPPGTQVIVEGSSALGIPELRQHITKNENRFKTVSKIVTPGWGRGYDPNAETHHTFETGHPRWPYMIVAKKQFQRIP